MLCFHAPLAYVVTMMMSSNPSVSSTPVFAAIPREGGGLVSMKYFCSSGVLGSRSSGYLATL